MSDTEARIRDDGPIVISGPVAVLGADGTPLVPPPGKDDVALCRCGNSGNKPFCDGTHRRAGFESAVRATASRE